MTGGNARRCVLVVEDDLNIRETLRLLLETEGYEVVTAENGAHALQVVGSGGRPCLILLDLFMPVMDGFEFLRRLRVHSDGSLAGLPVVLASAAPLDVLHSVSQSTSGYLRKPFDLTAILHVVGEHCGSESR